MDVVSVTSLSLNGTENLCSQRAPSVLEMFANEKEFSFTNVMRVGICLKTVCCKTQTVQRVKQSWVSRRRKALVNKLVCNPLPAGPEFLKFCLIFSYVLWAQGVGLNLETLKLNKYELRLPQDPWPLTCGSRTVNNRSSRCKSEQETILMSKQPIKVSFQMFVSQYVILANMKAFKHVSTWSSIWTDCPLHRNVIQVLYFLKVQIRN